MLAVLSACSGGEELPPPCPQLQMLKDTDRLVKFVGSGRDLTDVEYEAAMRAPFLTCEYDDNVIEATVIVNMGARRGPPMTIGWRRFPISWPAPIRAAVK